MTAEALAKCVLHLSLGGLRCSFNCCCLEGNAAKKCGQAVG